MIYPVKGAKKIDEPEAKACGKGSPLVFVADKQQQGNKRYPCKRKEIYCGKSEDQQQPGKKGRPIQPFGKRFQSVHNGPTILSFVVVFAVATKMEDIYFLPINFMQ